MVLQKAMVIRLRKAGYTYREIIAKVPVSKSSISLWLQDMPLTEAEKSILKHHRDAGISRGRIRAAASLRNLREERDATLFKHAKDEYEKYRENPLFYTGISLYWAEGSKRSNAFSFVNSDPEMIVLMLEWMETFLGVSRSGIRARLYIHKPYAHENCEEYWSRQTGIPTGHFGTTIYKPTDLLVKKRPGYKGCLRIEAGGVVALRTYLYWQKMMLDDYRKNSKLATPGGVRGRTLNRLS